MTKEERNELLEQKMPGHVAYWIIQYASWELAGIPVDMDQIIFSRQHMVHWIEEVEEHNLWAAYKGGNRLDDIAMATLHGMVIWFMKYAQGYIDIDITGLDLSIYVPEDLDYDKPDHKYTMQIGQTGRAHKVR